MNAAHCAHQSPHEVTYKETTMPVIEYYEKFGKVARVSSKSSSRSISPIRPQIDSSTAVDVVHVAAAEVVDKVLA